VQRIEPRYGRSQTVSSNPSSSKWSQDLIVGEETPKTRYSSNSREGYETNGNIRQSKGSDLLVPLIFGLKPESCLTRFEGGVVHYQEKIVFIAETNDAVETCLDKMISSATTNGVSTDGFISRLHLKTSSQGFISRLLKVSSQGFTSRLYPLSQGLISRLHLKASHDKSISQQEPNLISTCSSHVLLSLLPSLLPVSQGNPLPGLAFSCFE
jgi:hypothetical protein